MDSAIALPIGVVGACIVSGLFFWCTYRDQIEPAGGRGSEDTLSALQAREIQKEIELENQRSAERTREEKTSSGDVP